MNAEEMTPAELRALADSKELEAENQPPKLVKVGYAKSDLYAYCMVELAGNWVEDVECCTTEEKDEWFRKAFQLLYPKGTKFFCFLDCDEEYWTDSESGDPNQCFEDNDWVQFLENITQVKTDRIEIPITPRPDPEFDALPPEEQEKRRAAIMAACQEAKERCR